MRATTAALLALPLATLLAAPAAAQRDGEDNWLENCRRNGWGERGEVHCEVRESRVAVTSSLDVDASPNGGVKVTAWDRNEVLVRAKIQTRAPSDDEARALAGQLRIQTDGGRIAASGPETRGNRHWSVSFEVFVPRRTNLDVETTNGPIAIEGVSGTMALAAVNGPLSLTRVAGDVRGRTTNGPINVTLDGNAWSGAGLDVQTTNGPVTLRVPEGYNARLEAGTNNGPLSLDFPVMIQGRVSRRISTDLGRGGAPIRVTTTNGPVSLRRT
jgi:DUF4097 and DUF4098 domain-containing protein YvlB